MEEEIKACMKDMIKKVVKRDYKRRCREKGKEEREIKKCVKAMITTVVEREKLYNWRKNNRELYHKRQREYGKKYYQKNKEIIKKRIAETNSIRYWKDPASSRKKDREWRKAYILKYA